MRVDDDVPKRKHRDAFRFIDGFVLAGFDVNFFIRHLGSLSRSLRKYTWAGLMSDSAGIKLASARIREKEPVPCHPSKNGDETKKENGVLGGVSLP